MAGETPDSGELIEVVAGIVRDDRGRILLAERPAGKHLAGTWEFPGGKREPGETGLQALAREMAEELAISVGSARPWLALTHDYPELTVRLQLYAVDEWSGEPEGQEGQALQWVGESDMALLPMPAADRPIVRAFSLDPRYAITPDSAAPGGPEELLRWTRDCLDRGIRLFQLRATSLDPADLRSLAREFGRLMVESGARWLLDGDPELAVQSGADGVQLPGERLDELSGRPLGGDFLVAASCRNSAELARAGELALDFVTLRPGSAACGHQGPLPFDWEEFARLCRCSPLPVFALGGLLPGDLERVRERGGFGVAGTHGFGAGP
ncbi:Nudix family hydrolase [Wenzhouxiangella sediminis]|uniref:8-oxo-dGTP diphosphatase n=1 Tax=Wenzhouxiangella sediminis TaxID=1792836 RepID=A0A3E1K6X1_9GAMM|nr:Nudix family hydrolase [Wenzhouxiangella sediminis]RFF29721.1 Nudix family hydrolase [Wenzhouxiangella sediminis]